MGISAKVWAISDADIARCVAERDANVSVSLRHINHLFHAASNPDHYAKFWGARELHATLEHWTSAGLGFVVLDRSDPTYALDSKALRELLARGDVDLTQLAAPELPAVGGDSGGSVVEVMVRAVDAGLGVAFCIFEDW